ncbi:MAG: hypothetical protein NXY59_04695 [Aigarchaeota archaeon]|nr:hypothetical protein [Candidatus Pelearchaeum maunauluense]
MNSTIKVRITIGNTTVEVEAPPDQLEEAVRNVVAAIKAAGIAAQSEQPQLIPERKEQRAVTCRRIVEELLGEGWFSKPRSLGEVASELARRGFSYDRTAIAHVLLDMVREGLMRREGEARSYLYIESSREKNTQHDTQGTALE